MQDNQAQIRRRPVIRVFVSSTFTDLKHERDALQRDVFPKLEQLCASRQFQFQAIDLRWGVPTEASLDHCSMRICFEELRRSQEISPQPNFLILLGNRYGWRPLPEEVSEDEFRRLEQAASSESDRKILRAWYQRDENAVPSVYLLQSRKQNLNLDYTNDQVWSGVQRVLWDIINRSCPAAQLAGRFDHLAALDQPLPSIVRFQASATEQEIWRGALGAPNARQHVLAFVREIENVEEFRPVEIRDFVDVDESGAINAVSHGALRELRQELRKRLEESNIIGIEHARLFRASNGVPSADVTTGHLEELCARVHAALKDVITRQMDEYWGASDPSVVSPRELELERGEHQRFGQERAPPDSFVGRERHLQAIHACLHNNSNQPLVIHGASGCGKTALLARAAQEAAPEWQPVVRFIGVTPRSSDVRSLLGSLCQELRQRHPLESPTPGDVRELTKELDEHFKAATAQAPLILFLDALDQLADADNGPSLFWIPQLPGHVKLIVSCLSDRAPEDPAGQPYTALKRRGLAEENFINLDALSEAEAQTLIFERWLPQARRKLNAEQAQCIRERLKSDACRHPLYLKVLFEEARLWRSDDPAPTLGNNVSELLGDMFKRLGDPSNHGPTLESALGYLAAARHGLTETEILEVLYQDPDYAKFLEQMTARTGHKLPDNPKRVPIAIWSRLRFDLAPYLAEHAAPGGTVLNFYHRQVAEFVRGQFLDTPLKRQQRHERLAGYFVACAKGSDSAHEWETLAVGGFGECIFHLAKAQQHEVAAELLSTFPFLLHKLRVGLLEGVFEDYEILRREVPTDLGKRLDIWADFFREGAHILRRGNKEWPTHKILLQLAIEHADDSPLTLAAEQWLAQGQCDWVWLCRIQRLPHIHKNPCFGVLEGHIGPVRGALLLANGRLVSWVGGLNSKDYSLRLWHGETGACLKVLEGHTSSVEGALELSDGRLLSWSYGGPLRLWDSVAGVPLITLDADNVSCAVELKNGQIVSWGWDAAPTLSLWESQRGVRMLTFKGHTRWQVIGALELSDGRLLSWGDDETLRLWDSRSGACLRVLVWHFGAVLGGLALTNGLLLSWSRDGTLRLWDGKTGERVAVLEGHTDSVNGALELADGRLLSWSDDGTLRLWEMPSVRCMATLKGHTDYVNGARVLAAGRLLSWSRDGTLRLWDSHSGACVATLHGHTGSVACVLQLADGRLLSRSWPQEEKVIDKPFRSSDRHPVTDKTLRLWDIQKGACLATIIGHTGPVNGMLELLDGRVVSWSDDGTLRLWDSKYTDSIPPLQGHMNAVKDGIVLADGRLVSWAEDCASGDYSLRVWDSQNGDCLKILEGHTSGVNGALELSDGRLLSWSTWPDSTLRLWDSQGGRCLTVLREHKGSIDGALELADGRLVSWSIDLNFDSIGELRSWTRHRYRIWDSRNGTCIEAVSKEDLKPLYPELAEALPAATNSFHSIGNFHVGSSRSSVWLRHETLPGSVIWEADTAAKALSLLADGTAAAGLSSGQVCILKLRHGQRRVSLAETEGLLALQRKKAE